MQYNNNLKQKIQLQSGNLLVTSQFRDHFEKFSEPKKCTKIR